MFYFLFRAPRAYNLDKPEDIFGVALQNKYRNFPRLQSTAAETDDITSKEHSFNLSID